ncbi:VWA domain-containing protein [Collinsella tanakaei]|uniref:vWA domain-containing protein n=1 Tax=Collinsella tanakaei TaxID=626935 RepID=UPI00195745D1|nr:vWA domain-containing protein [Collinsella tanakaei]MBM6756257.1 VWA domain-containing protein [Collinsella tanakaei]
MSKKQQVKQGNRTEIVFILDASGSMSGLESDTVGGFNGMIERNREEPGEAVVSTIIFNDKSYVLHDRIDIREVPRLTRRQYRCSGCTALLDAVGGAIKHVDVVQGVLPDGYKADKVLFVITTDGMENASRRFSYAQIKNMIERRRKQGWEFLFIGANIDAGAEAEQLGIERDRAADYLADEQGTEVLYAAMASAVASVRSAPAGGVLGNTWREGLDEDIRTRR